MIQDLTAIFERDLNALKKEISSYPSEADLWVVGGDVSNSAGNLCLHLVGNLSHFIGHIIGKTTYVRERDKEFLLKNVPRAELLKMIDETIHTLKQSLSTLDEDDLGKTYPVKVLATETSTGFFLIHLISHLDYHLGQINYHRRLTNTVYAVAK